MISLGGLLLFLPLPPGTNAPPALALILLCIGTLQHDIVFVILGTLILFLFTLALLSLALLGLDLLQVISGGLQTSQI